MFRRGTKAKYLIVLNKYQPPNNIPLNSLQANPPRQELLPMSPNKSTHVSASKESDMQLCSPIVPFEPEHTPVQPPGKQLLDVAGQLIVGDTVVDNVGLNVGFNVG